MDLENLHKLTCSNCGELNIVMPKMVGHSPRWELCCDCCSNVDVAGICPYEADISELQYACDACEKKEKTINEVLEELKTSKVATISKPCICGGQHTIFATPRCTTCSESLHPTIFHYTISADQAIRWK